MVFTACKKTDSLVSSTLQDASPTEEKFFNSYRTGNAIEKALINYLKKVNEKDSFVKKTVNQIGYPRWDKAITQGKKKNINNNFAGDSSQTFYIPFVRDSQNYVNASMVINLTPTDTSFFYRCDWEYRLLQNDGAESLATFFMSLDKVVFNHKKFKIIDSSLFESSNGNALFIRLDTVGSNYTPSNNYWELELMCDWVYTYYVACGFPNSPQCINGCDACYRCIGFYSTRVCWEQWVWNGGSGTPGGNTGGGNPGGGGSTPPPCDVVPIGLMGRVVDPCDQGPGWEPIPIDPEPPFVPYVCNYQMTQHEQDVFNLIDAEDNLADQNHQNLDCQGTKRTGNIFFKGTKEHWMIQLDYVSKNSVYGDVEFAIPNSSPSGNRGYADIVNLQSKSIFEIKPNNPAGQSSGASEVANYVLKANQYCGSTIPMGVSWNAGTSFAPIILPTNISNRFLKAELYSPGVIVYSYENMSNPIPFPQAVPASIVPKFKHLIDRLRQNFHQADKIISEYLADPDNADVLVYIKGAAIAAGVAIIVGTIIEDFLTAGAGILDDWQCFVLAYRIIRYAVKL